MIKILQIRQNKPGGTDNYCHGLQSLLTHDADCQVMPVTDIPQQPSRLFHYYYRNQDLEPFIAEADIVHVNGYTAQGTIDAMRLAHRMGKKVVYTAHFHPFRYLGHPMAGRLFFYLKMKPAIQRYADVVTTINNEDTRFFRSIHKRVVQIPHWNNTTENAHHIAERNPRMILFVGRIDDHVKGFQQLAALPENRYEIHCVGRGQLPFQRTDVIHHTDITTEELQRLYQQAALLVVPSKYEAFSFVTLEAMVQGTPVVMSDRVRIADYLNGIKGYAIYPYGDTPTFIEKVEETIGSDVDMVAIKQRFDPQQIIEQYKHIYLSL
jgi:glycosyltransferase involved in cell wall biosynthesis